MAFDWDNWEKDLTGTTWTRDFDWDNWNKGF
jgi:hypothetical protein